MEPDYSTLLYSLWYPLREPLMGTRCRRKADSGNLGKQGSGSVSRATSREGLPLLGSLLRKQITIYVVLACCLRW